MEQPARRRRVSAFQLFAYVLPTVPLAALGLPLVVHLPPFYASKEIGLSIGMVGLVFSLARMWDVVLDPTMGYWSDRWRTRFGRRKPLIVLGTPILLLGIWMTFIPGGPISPLHASIWLFILYVGWSMTTIPQLSWGAELSTDYHERSRIFGWVQIASIIGLVAVLTIPAVMEHNGATLAARLFAMAMFAIVILVPSVALAVFAVPEPEVKLKTHTGFIPTLRFLWKDRALRRVILVDLIASTSAGAVGAMFFFFADYVLGLGKWSGSMLLVYFLSGCFCVPAWMALSRRIGKHRTLIISSLYTVVLATTQLLIPRGNVGAALVVYALNGVSYGAASFLLRSMMADVADADAAENNTERAGLMYSFLALTNKFGLGWSVGIAYAILAWIGFSATAANTPGAIEGLRFVYVGISVVFGLANAAIMLSYPLDEARQKRLRDEIEQRRTAHRAADDMLPPGLLPGGAALASDSEAITDIEGTVP
ncbi:MAG TPA: MFS transporter [Rhizomicrobium sp.]|nr:MFS transporter [Rhizomicrobium sp.]